MNPAAANATPMIAIGIIQLLSGIAIFLTDVLSLSLYGFSGTVYTGIVLGIFYIITGSIGAAAGSSARNPAGSGRCLAIASLVMSILSILNAFSLIIWCSFFLSTVWYPGYYYFFVIRYYGPSVVGAQLAFFVIVFIASIVMCVFSTRAMNAMRSSMMTTVTHVTHVVQQPGMVYNTAQYPGQQFVYPPQQPYAPQQPYGQPPAGAYAYPGQQSYAPPAPLKV